MKGVRVRREKYKFVSDKDVKLFIDEFKVRGPFMQKVRISGLVEDIECDNRWMHEKILQILERDYTDFRKRLNGKLFMNAYLTELLKEQTNEERLNRRQLKIRALGLAISHSKRGTGSTKRERYRELVETNMFGYLPTIKRSQVW